MLQMCEYMNNFFVFRVDEIDGNSLASVNELMSEIENIIKIRSF